MKSKNKFDAISDRHHILCEYLDLLEEQKDIVNKINRLTRRADEDLDIIRKSFKMKLNSNKEYFVNVGKTTVLKQSITWPGCLIIPVIKIGSNCFTWTTSSAVEKELGEFYSKEKLRSRYWVTRFRLKINEGKFMEKNACLKFNGLDVKKFNSMRKSKDPVIKKMLSQLILHLKLK